jgi:hypothetical protein
VITQKREAERTRNEPGAEDWSEKERININHIRQRCKGTEVRELLIKD